MKNNYLKLLFTLIISSFLAGNALASYKHKVVVTAFEDPHVWQKHFSPGKILSNRLEKALIKGNSFQIIPDGKIENRMNQNMPPSNTMDNLPMPKASSMDMDKLGSMSNLKMEHNPGVDENSNFPGKKYKQSFKKKRESPYYGTEGSNARYQKQTDIEPAVFYWDEYSSGNLLQVQGSPDAMMRSMENIPNETMMIPGDPFPWPVKLGEIPEKASLYKIRGQVVKFDPGSLDTSMKNSGNMLTRNSENAKVEVMLQLVQNKTGRILKKQTFRAFSNSGRRPFSEDIDLSPREERNLESSSMGLALLFLTKEMASFVNETISASALEGEVIATEKDDVLINVGMRNGVEVGDKFRVYSVGLGLDDPFTEMDLGDIYVKMGIIQVVETMLGFSKAAVIVGKDFLPGNMVQSVKRTKNSGQRLSSGSKSFKTDEAIPWWDFGGIKSIP